MLCEGLAATSSVPLRELLDALALTESRLAEAQAKNRQLELGAHVQSGISREGYDFVFQERSALEVRMKDLQEHLDQEAENFDTLATVHEETLDLLGRIKEEKVGFRGMLEHAHREREAAEKKLAQMQLELDALSTERDAAVSTVRCASDSEVSRDREDQLAQMQEELEAVSAERDASVSQVQSLEAECESTCWLRQQLAESEDFLCESETREAQQGQKLDQAVKQCNHLEHQLAESRSHQLALQQQLDELQAKGKSQLQLEGCDGEERPRAVSSLVADFEEKTKADGEERPRAVSSLVADFEEKTKAVRGGVPVVADSPARAAALEPEATAVKLEHSGLASPENYMEDQFQRIVSQQEMEGVQHLFSSALDELVDERDSAVHDLDEARQQVVRLELDVQALNLSMSNQHDRLNASMKQEMQTQMQQEANQWMTSVQDQAKDALAQRDKLIWDLQQQLQARDCPKEGVKDIELPPFGPPILPGKAEPAAAG